MIISNAINNRVQIGNYQFDHQKALLLATEMDSIDLGINRPITESFCKHRLRNEQDDYLLCRLENALIPCQYGDWLAQRNVSVKEAYSIDYDMVSMQDLLDLHIFPDDYILDECGNRPIEGPMFLDRRNGKLVGICVRNATKDLDYAAAEKYTISNQGWYVYGFDLSEPNDTVYLVEGVFDAIAMRKHGLHAVAVASAYPTSIQLECILHKFPNIRLCFDNDFWGRVGSYIISKCTGIPIFFTEMKDPACYSESRSIQLTEKSLSDLEDKLPAEIADYNKKVLSGEQFERPLPYN